VYFIDEYGYYIWLGDFGIFEDFAVKDHYRLINLLRLRSMAIHCDSKMNANKLFISLSLVGVNQMDRKVLWHDDLFEHYNPQPTYIENYNQEIQIILIPTYTNLQIEDLLEKILNCIKNGYSKNKLRFNVKCRLCFIGSNEISFNSVLNTKNICEYFKFKNGLSHFMYGERNITKDITGFMEDTVLDSEYNKLGGINFITINSYGRSQYSNMIRNVSRDTQKRLYSNKPNRKSLFNVQTRFNSSNITEQNDSYIKHNKLCNDYNKMIKINNDKDTIIRTLYTSIDFKYNGQVFNKFIKDNNNKNIILCVSGNRDAMMVSANKRVYFENILKKYNFSTDNIEDFIVYKYNDGKDIYNLNINLMGDFKIEGYPEWINEYIDSLETKSKKIIIINIDDLIKIVHRLDDYQIFLTFNTFLYIAMNKPNWKVIIEDINYVFKLELFVKTQFVLGTRMIKPLPKNKLISNNAVSNDVLIFRYYYKLLKILKSIIENKSWNKVCSSELNRITNEYNDIKELSGNNSTIMYDLSPSLSYIMEKKFIFINKDISILDCIGLCAHNITGLGMAEEVDDCDSVDVIIYQFMFSKVDIRLFQDNPNHIETIRILHGYYLMCHAILGEKNKMSIENIRYLNFIWHKIQFYTSHVEIYKGKSGVHNIWVYPVHLHFDHEYTDFSLISRNELSGLCCHNVINIFGTHKVNFLMMIEKELNVYKYYHELSEEFKSVELKHETFFPIY
jgi:hypothetical protein